MKSASSGIFVLLSLLFDLATCKLSLSLPAAHKNEGETNFFVLCRDPDKGSKVVWRNQKNRLINNKNENNVVKDTTHGSQLIFKTIRKADEGTYYCKSGKDQIEFQLFVTAPVEIVNTSTQVTGKEGADIVMGCEAINGNPEVLVDGNKPTDDAKYKVLGDGLLIINATAEDSQHQYTCQAINMEKGILKTLDITLTVKHPPRPLYEQEKVVYGYLGGKVNLTCEVAAEPAPHFKWFRHDKRKIIGQNVHLTNPRASVLQVFLESLKDFGEYKCESSNTEGIHVTSFSLERGYPPEPPEFVDIVEANSTSMSIYIEPPNVTQDEVKPKLVPIGFLVEYRPLEEPFWNAQTFPQIAEDKTYILTNLTKNTTYQVRVATLNLAGSSEFTNETVYTTTSSAFMFNAPNIFITFTVLFSVNKLFITLI